MMKLLGNQGKVVGYSSQVFDSGVLRRIVLFATVA